MAKFKITITTTIEYEPSDPKYYPGCDTLEEMLALDIENGKDDPFLMMGMGEAETKVSGEILEE